MSGPRSTDRSRLRTNPLYDAGAAKVTVFATVLIVFSIILTGVIAYYITKGQSVKKLKETDLEYIGGSIASKIDGRIERAMETARLLAGNRDLNEWILGGERLGGEETVALETIRRMTEQFQYDNSFIVSVLTGQYWTEQGQLLDTMTRSDPDDAWFFRTLEDGRPVQLDIDYNEERKDTFIFVNALMRHNGAPVSVVGIGLSLQDMSQQFGEYKYGLHGNLWLTDKSGEIYLSDEFAQNGHNMLDYMPPESADRLLSMMDRERAVTEYVDADGNRKDVMLFPIASSEWSLVVAVDRNEAISFLKTIQWQTAAAVAISLLTVVFFFTYMSRKLADPYKRAIELNEELERQIAARTKELAEQNEKILDSLDYASRIQVSALPTDAELKEALPGHFILWKPRDRVGGDFYWLKRVKRGLLIAVGDCTGHGVPGALMSIMTVSLLDQLVNSDSDDPAAILTRLNRSIKQTLNQNGKEGLTDDGLDIGLCLLTDTATVFAGAGCSLLVRTPDGLEEYEGDRKSVGYRKTPADYPYTNKVVVVGPDAVHYLTTDGLADQNGGDKNYSYGKTRWKKWVAANGDAPFDRQRTMLEADIDRYRGDEPQRDDMTVLGFLPPRKG